MHVTLILPNSTYMRIVMLEVMGENTTENGSNRNQEQMLLDFIYTCTWLLFKLYIPLIAVPYGVENPVCHTR